MAMRNMWKLLATIAIILPALLCGSTVEAAVDKGGKAPSATKSGKKSRKTKQGGSAEPASVDPAPAAEPGSDEPATEPGSDPAPAAPMRIVGKVVYGDASASENLATVDVKEVFDHLPSYRKIQEENLKKTKARYHFLLAQANEEFRTAVTSAARTAGVLAVVEAGGVENPDDSVTDLTAKVIEDLDD